MKQSTFKDISNKIYIQIKEDYGDNYKHVYYDLLAEMNGLSDIDLYRKLKSIPTIKDNNYLVAVMDDKFNCIHVGYTESPLFYWIGYLKKGAFPSIKDIIILDDGLDMKVARRKAKELKTNMTRLTRQLKIKIALE